MIPLSPRTRKRSTAWKATLILIPLVTAGLLFWLRQTQVQQLKNRHLSSYGTVPQFELVNQDAQPFGSDAVVRQDLDRRFYFHQLSGAMSRSSAPG